MNTVLTVICITVLLNLSKSILTDIRGHWMTKGVGPLNCHEVSNQEYGITRDINNAILISASFVYVIRLLTILISASFVYVIRPLTIFISALFVYDIRLLCVSLTPIRYK